MTRTPRPTRLLRLEKLEDRFTPDANLALTNAVLVDANNVALTAPPSGGEEVFIRAEFTTEDLPSDAAYRISVSVDGDTRTTDYINWGAGDAGAGSWNY